MAAPPPSPDCIIAEIDGAALSIADAKAFRRHIEPAPTLAAAIRLAVDATVAYWGSSGHVDGSVPEKLGAYRKLLSDSRVGAGSLGAYADQAAAAIAELGQRAGLELGPCYTPLGPATEP